MKDRSAVIWTRINVQPVKMGTLYVTDSDARFTYDSKYPDLKLPGLGLVFSPVYFADTTMTFRRNDYFDLFPPVQAMIPPRAERNFQRELVLQYLKSQNISYDKGFDADWKILMASGHGGIGHLDIFPDDESAMKWYASPVNNALHTVEDDFGFSLKEFMTWFDEDATTLLDVIGPTPSVGGAIPKLLLSIPKEGWTNQIALPTRYGDTDRTDIVLKFEQSTIYPGITELEGLALDIHREAGFDVPRHWQVKIGELEAIAVERFDRIDNTPCFIESMYSVLASGNKDITNNYSATYDMVGRAIDNTKINIVDDKLAAKRHLLKRLLLAFITGNGDFHLENMSLLMVNGQTSFSPVYDPTPMRAYSIHNMLTPMPFGQYGEFDDTLDTNIDFLMAINNFAKNLSIKSDELSAMIVEVIEVTHHFPDRVNALTLLPDANKSNLIEIHHNIKEKLTRLC